MVTGILVKEKILETCERERGNKPVERILLIQGFLVLSEEAEIFDKSGGDVLVVQELSKDHKWRPITNYQQ